jgi:hypothetical protein
MPDPILMVESAVTAGGVAAVVLLALAWPWRRAPGVRVGIGWVVGVTAGFALGAWLLGYRPAWPIGQDRDRLLLIILPAAFVIELIGALPLVREWRMGQVALCVLRLALAAATAPILLHQTQYLADLAGPGTALWSGRRMWAWLAGLAGALALQWVALSILLRRGGSETARGQGGGGRAIPLAVAMAVGGSALTIMLTGSLVTGQAALALAGALTGAAVASLLLSPAAATNASLGVGLVCWFSLLISGRFFADLTTVQAAALWFAPLLCWLPPLVPGVRRWRPWARAVICLALVGFLIAVIIFQAHRQFARDSAGEQAAGSSRWYIEPRPV